MAIQNDNTILKKADLKAYHERIAPMLGGTFMVGTNNSDYYSTDEKVVGVWTDGRPLYQKTYSLTTPSTTADTIIGSLDSSCIVREMTGFVENAGAYLPIMFKYGDDSNNYIIIYISATNVRCKVASGYTSKPVHLTVKYTKTTDTAGSATATPGAYDINFPNTWPANTEIYFGNGMYGYRATGSTAITSGTVKSWDAVSITRTANTKIYNYGGTWKRSSAIPVAADTVFGIPLSDDLNINSGVMIGSQAIIFTVKDAFTGTVDYDFFVTYTK